MGNLALIEGFSEKLFTSFSDSNNIKSLCTSDFLLEKIFLVENNYPIAYFKLHKILEQKLTYLLGEESILIKTRSRDFNGNVEVCIVKICLTEKQDKFFFPDPILLKMFTDEQLDSLREVHVSTR